MEYRQQAGSTTPGPRPWAPRCCMGYVNQSDSHTSELIIKILEHEHD